MKGFIRRAAILLRLVLVALPVAAQEGTPTPSPTPDVQNPPPTKKPDPFAFGDFTWLTGISRQKDYPIDTKVFTGEVRVDVNYVVDGNYPIDDTIGGSSEIFRSSEFQLTQLGVGGDFHWNNVRGRLLRRSESSKSTHILR